MNKASLLIFTMFFLALTISSVQGQVVVPAATGATDGEELQVITDLVEDFSQPYSAVILNNYEILIPDGTNYDSFAISDYVTVEVLDDLGKVIRKLEYGTKPKVINSGSLSLASENKKSKIKFVDKTINLNVENIPENTYQLEIILIRKEIIPVFTSCPYCWDVRLVWLSGDGTYPITIEGLNSDTPFEFDLIVVARVHDEQNYRHHVWMEKIDLSSVDEQEVEINFIDNELKELKTNVYEIMDYGINGPPELYGFSILFKETNHKFFVSAKKSDKIFKTFLKYSGSWGIHQYGVPVAYDYTSSEDNVIIFLTTEYDYPFDSLNDNIEPSEIKKLTFSFNEFYVTPMYDAVWWGNYHAGYDVFGQLHSTFYSAGWGNARNFDWYTPEEDPIVDFYFRDISKCFDCGLGATLQKHIMEDAQDVLSFDASFANGNQYGFPMELPEQTQISVFEEPFKLNTLIGEQIPLISDYVYPSASYFSTTFKDKENHAFGARFFGMPLSELKTVASTPDGDIVEYEGEDTYYAMVEGEILFPFKFPDNTEAIHTTWHTINLFNPDICLESHYSKIRSVGDESPVGDTWAESKRTGIWDPFTETCLFDSGSIPEGPETPTFGWATGPFGGMYNTVVISLLIVIVIVALGGSVIYNATKRGKRGFWIFKF